MDVLAWWLGVVLHHGLGGIAFGLLTLAVAACVVLAVGAGILHGIAGVRDAFTTGWRRGWDRPSSGGDAAGE